VVGRIARILRRRRGV
jgi:hypothetical protein